MAHSRLAVITFLQSEGDEIDNSLPIPPMYPGQGLPGGSGNRPDNSLPGSIGTLPVFPFDPTVGIDNSLPTPPGTINPPIQLHPGLKLVVKYMACHGFIAVPDNELPATGEPK